MAIEAPTLDDRRFDDLVAEARSLIPRYAPEWTDHNESDPGIALLQLHAWFTDQLIYRLNRVPDRNYRKFLALVGIDVRPASPARVDLAFTTSLANVDVVVPAGTQVATTGSSDDTPIVFELPEALVAIGPRLDALQVYDGFAYRTVTTANAATGQGIDPFGQRARAGAALLLGFDSPSAFTANPITLMLYAAQPLGAPVVQAQLEQAPVPPPARLAYEYWDGASWEPLSERLDETWALMRSGRIVVAAPAARPAKAKIGDVVATRYWLRIRLVDPHYDRVPRLAQIVVNVATAIAATTISDEVLGGSDGMPDQGPLRLSSAPVVALDRPVQLRRSDGVAVTVTSLQLDVDEGSGFEPWQEVDDLSVSGPDDRHYVLDRATGEVRFGNGRFGRIPVANASNPTGNIVARHYRAGGGTRTNAGARTVNVLQSAVTGIATVVNPRQAAGGADQETVDDAKRRAPSALKARDRAVTAEDFETLALQTPAPVARAKALALHHPGFPDVAVPGAVTVVVVPDVDSRAPRPSEATLQLVCRQLDAHRLITTEVFAVGPVYRPVKLVGDIVVRGNADLTAVRQALADRLVAWLHPLSGGDDGAGWPFGGTIYASSLYRVALEVPGVDRIRDNQLVVQLDGEVQLFCRDVELGAGELIEPLDPELAVSYG
jgi:predicted phage baseplate assembly protein